ncbi:MAG TPA: hypothetical protein VGB30_14895 [bacterium]|jgi:hypothetical protein
MKLSIIALTVYISVSIFILSCSGSDGITPGEISPGNSEITSSQNSGFNAGNKYLWGYFIRKLDPQTGTFELVPVREISTHFNVL